jgi:hypothetical protein
VYLQLNTNSYRLCNHTIKDNLNKGVLLHVKLNS